MTDSAQVPGMLLRSRARGGRRAGGGRFARIAVLGGMLALAGCRDGGGNILNPNQPPGRPVITSPANGSTHGPGVTVSFQGSANDVEDGVLSGASLVWTSSRDGEIGTGMSFSRDDLSEGTHTISLKATDSGSLNSVVSISITIENTAPAAEISSPGDGASFSIGTDVRFEGSGTDVEDGALTGEDLIWTSSLDGLLGTGSPLTTDELSEGIHVITLTARDSRGATAVATVTVSVENQPPDVTITNPADGAIFIVDSAVEFLGSATDLEDGPIPAGDLVWTSSLDGPIGAGASFERSDLSLGEHTITLTATDSEGVDGTAVITLRILGPPSVTIELPTPGASFPQGTSVTFRGRADDPEDGTLGGASMVWSSNLNGVIGMGLTFTRPDLSVGPHQITLAATDSDGITIVKTVNITITGNGDPPVVTIASPTGGVEYPSGTEITFQGSAADAEDGPITGGGLVWTSSRDGPLGTGTTFGRADLSLGSHTITLRATDSDALVGTAQVTIMVVGGPQATITAPASGATFAAGTSIGFQGSATDPEDGALMGGSLVWTSDRDGPLGTGTSFNKSDLSVGVHVVTMTATDSDGFAATSSVTVVIQPPGSAPVAAITSPVTGSTFDQGTSVTFQGTGTDAEDGALVSGSLVWTSDLDGQIGTGTSFNRSNLSVGMHIITLTATDSQANTRTATVVMTVREGLPPAASISSPSTATTLGAGVSVSFQGTAYDADDGPLTGDRLVWTSTLDGPIGTGTSFSRSALSIGTHTVTLTATDSDGLTSTASTTLTVVQTTAILVKAGNTASTSIGLGQQATIPIVVDLSQYPLASNDDRLASVQVRVTWDPAVAGYVSASPGPFGIVDINADQVGDGVVVAGTINGSGRASPFTLFTLTLFGAAAGTTNVAMEVRVAGTEAGPDPDVTSLVGTRSHGLTVGN